MYPVKAALILTVLLLAGVSAGSAQKIKDKEGKVTVLLTSGPDVGRLRRFAPSG